MDLAKRIKQSEVFADLSQEDLEVILQAFEAGNEEVIKEVTEILDQEKTINELFDKSIDELTEYTVDVITKRVEGMEKRRKAAKEEAVDHAHEMGEAEYELELYKTTSN